MQWSSTTATRSSPPGRERRSPSRRRHHRRRFRQDDRARSLGHARPLPAGRAWRRLPRVRRHHRARSRQYPRVRDGHSRRHRRRQRLGPRILASGLVDGEGQRAAGTIIIKSNADIVPVLERLKRAGCHEVKIYSSIDPRLVKPIAAEAHRRGMRVVGHVPEGMDVVAALDAGFDGVSHATYLFGPLFAPGEMQKLSAAPFGAASQKRASTIPSSARWFAPSSPRKPSSTIRWLSSIS